MYRTLLTLACCILYSAAGAASDLSSVYVAPGGIYAPAANVYVGPGQTNRPYAEPGYGYRQPSYDVDPAYRAPAAVYGDYRPSYAPRPVYVDRAPAYPELVLTVTRETLQDDAPTVRAAIRALQRGYGEAQTDPESAVATMVAAEPGLDAEALTAQFDAVAPAFTAGAREYGQLRTPVLEEWADWDVEFGILDARPDVGAAFDTSLVGPAGRD